VKELIIIFIILCIPLTYLMLELEKQPEEVIIYYFEEEEPDLEKEIVIKQVPKPKEQVKPIETQPQNDTEPIVNDTEPVEVPILSTTLPKKGTLNEQNSQKYTNTVYALNQMRGFVVFYTDNECYLRLNPNLNEKDWENYITTMQIPLHYKFTEKYCKLIKSNFE
jgi:hypothetical protein